MPPTPILVTGVLLLCLVLPAAAEDEAPADPVEQALAAPQATGLLVTQVVGGTQAEKAGFLAGDVLTRYGAVAVTSIDALREAMQAVESETVDVVVVRRDGSEKTFALEPGPMGLQLAPVEKGKGVDPLPPATDVAFDFASLAAAPHDDWYAFTMNGERVGFEHAICTLEDGRLVMRREVAFDGGEQWGVNHFDVTVVLMAEPVPELVSLRFENPIHGYVGQGLPTKDDAGKAVIRYTQSVGDEEEVAEHAVPADLPAIPSYVVETLACFMPREQGACFHYRAVEDGSGAVGRPAALLVEGEEEIEVGGTKTKTWRLRVHTFGGGASTAFWVNAARRVVKADYMGAVTVAAKKEDCLKDLHHGLRPRTAE